MFFVFVSRAAPVKDSSSLICLVEAKCLNRPAFLLLTLARNNFFVFIFGAAPAADSLSLVGPVEAKCLDEHDGGIIIGAKRPNRSGTEQVCSLSWCQAHPVADSSMGSSPRAAVPAQPPFVHGRSAVLHASPPGPSIFGHF